MKKLNLIFVLCLSILVASCSSDDGDSPSNIDEEAVLGTWIGVDIDYSGNTAINFEGETIVSDFVGDAYDVDYSITFNDNPQEFLSEGSYSVELTTTIFGQTQVQNVENIEFLDNGMWSISGNQLTITSDGESSTGTISLLSNGLIQLSYSTVEIVNENGIENTVTLNVISTFERQ